MFQKTDFSLKIKRFWKHKIFSINKKVALSDIDASLTGRITGIASSGSYFKDVKIDVVYAATVQIGVNNAMLNIVIPIYSEKIEGDYGVNIVYQFNSDTTNIEYVISWN